LRTFQLKNYIQPNKGKGITEEAIALNDEESMKVESLISQIQDGSVDPKTIEWPTVVKDGRLVRKSSVGNEIPKGTKVDETMATALIKEAGSVEGARKLATQRGLVF
jgi:hypothetical protein